jgi:hypothetical protein
MQELEMRQRPSCGKIVKRALSDGMAPVTVMSALRLSSILFSGFKEAEMDGKLTLTEKEVPANYAYD